MEEMKVVWTVAGLALAVVVIATILWYYTWKH
nr:MAG TPA: hypothetical protein [Caudoviricetes sp.]